MTVVTIRMNPSLLELQEEDAWLESTDRYAHWLAEGIKHHWPDSTLHVKWVPTLGLIISIEGRIGKHPTRMDILRVMTEVWTEEPWRIPLERGQEHDERFQPVACRPGK